VKTLAAFRRGPVWLRSVLLWRVVLLLVLLGAWELASGTLVPQLFISKPSMVIPRIIELFPTSELWTAVGITYYEVAVGYVLAAVTGIVLGVVLGRSAFLAAVTEPFIMTLYSLPKIALAPLFILWLGVGLESKIAIVFISALFLVMFNTFAGIRGINEEFINLARIMGANWRDVNFRVILPAAFPSIFLGLKAAMPYAVIGAVTGEFMASNSGLGFNILRSGNTLDTTSMFAWLFFLVVGVTVVNELLRLVEKRVLRWQPGSGTRARRVRTPAVA